MKMTGFDWDTELEDAARLCCPICDTAWITDTGDDHVRAECGHLRFIFMEDDLECLGEWESAAFKDAYREALLKQQDPEDQKLYSLYADYDVLESMDFPEIDEILVHTETDMACGPVSCTAFFGMKS